MRDDRCAFAVKHLIRTDMVAVCVGVDHEIYRVTCQCLDRGDGDCNQRFEPVIDQYDAIVAGDQAEIAARESALAFKHVKTRCKLGGFPGNVLCLSRDGAGKS